MADQLILPAGAAADLHDVAGINVLDFRTGARLVIDRKPYEVHKLGLVPFPPPGRVWRHVRVEAGAAGAIVLDYVTDTGHELGTAPVLPVGGGATPIAYAGPSGPVPAAGDEDGRADVRCHDGEGNPFAATKGSEAVAIPLPDDDWAQAVVAHGRSEATGQRPVPIRMDSAGRLQVRSVQDPVDARMHDAAGNGIASTSGNNPTSPSAGTRSLRVLQHGRVDDNTTRVLLLDGDGRTVLAGREVLYSAVDADPNHDAIAVVTPYREVLVFVHINHAGGSGDVTVTVEAHWHQGGAVYSIRTLATFLAAAGTHVMRAVTIAPGAVDGHSDATFEAIAKAMGVPDRVRVRVTGGTPGNSTFFRIVGAR